MKKELCGNNLVLDAAQVVWLAQNSERPKIFPKGCEKDVEVLLVPVEARERSSGTRPNRPTQRDATCDNSPKESEEGDNGKYLHRGRVCSSARIMRRQCTNGCSRLSLQEDRTCSSGEVVRSGFMKRVADSS